MLVALRPVVRLHTQLGNDTALRLAIQSMPGQLLRYVSSSSSDPDILDQLMRYISPSSSDPTIYCVQ
ncbi:unnamed protein product [Linum trigynum]|uniref:Uncharacterized protein n=1 Tax=Linum trigynum TaxID=586398 RepID=A0AAV2CFG5_9ROSI